MSRVRVEYERILAGRALRAPVAVFRNADDPSARPLSDPGTPPRVARNTYSLREFRAATADRAGLLPARAGLVRGLHWCLP